MSGQRDTEELRMKQDWCFCDGEIVAELGRSVPSLSLGGVGGRMKASMAASYWCNTSNSSPTILPYILGRKVGKNLKL